MGKRRRWAALGATFALLVAACAATTSSETVSVDPGFNSSPTGLPDTASLDTVAFADSPADAGFLHPPNGGTCETTNDAALLLFDPATGEQRSSLALPRPAGASTFSGSTAFIAFTWDQGQRPGIGAVDLNTHQPKWQRFLNSEPQDLAIVDNSLLVASLDDVRAIDTETGEDLWILGSQFDLRTVVFGADLVFALDQVGVHAIDPTTGEIEWQLPVDRPDSLAVSDATLAVASRTQLIGVDIAAARPLFDIQVDRTGAGDLWVSPTSVLVELSTTVAPGGGIAAINSRTGVETWRNTAIGAPVFPNAGADILVASTANAEPNPGAPFMMFGIDVNSGERVWETPSTEQAFNAVIGATEHRVAIQQPHEAIPGLRTVRLIDISNGRVLWQTATDLEVDGAAITITDSVTLYGSSPVVLDARGTVAARPTASQWWSATTVAGVTQAPLFTSAGLVVVSGERLPTCVGRSVGEPSVDTEVLGTTETN